MHPYVYCIWSMVVNDALPLKLPVTALDLKLSAQYFIEIIQSVLFFARTVYFCIFLYILFYPVKKERPVLERTVVIKVSNKGFMQGSLLLCSPTISLFTKDLVTYIVVCTILLIRLNICEFLQKSLY